MPLAGRPLVEWSIAAFRACEAVEAIVVACPPGYGDVLGGADVAVVAGGATRSESVAKALAAVDSEIVAIHDAARPLLTPELVDGVVATLLADADADGAIAAAPVTDTIKQMQPANAPEESDEVTRGAFTTPWGENAPLAIDSTLDRGRLWAAQTPQAFRTAALRSALADYPAGAPDATDEAMLLEAAGGKVLIRPAPPENLKVTTPFDLKLAEMMLGERA